MHIKPATVAAQTRTRRAPAQRARRAPTIPSCNFLSRPAARRATKALRRAPLRWVSRERDRRGLRDRDHAGRRQGLRRQRVHRSLCCDERPPTRVTEHSGAALSGARRDRGQCGLRDIGTEAQVDSTGLWLGQNHRLNPTHDAARIEASESDFYVNDGGVQLNADERLGRTASADSVTKPRDVKGIKQASRRS